MFIYFSTLDASSTPAQPSAKRGRPPKEPKLLVSKYKGTSQGSRPLSDKVIKLREDGTSPGSPSTTTETSSSEQESSSEEESEYEEEEEMEDISKVSIKSPSFMTEYKPSINSV
jgi:hypothetical protein